MWYLLRNFEDDWIVTHPEYNSCKLYVHWQFHRREQHRQQQQQQNQSMEVSKVNELPLF